MFPGHLLWPLNSTQHLFSSIFLNTILWYRLRYGNFSITKPTRFRWERLGAKCIWFNSIFCIFLLYSYVGTLSFLKTLRSVLIPQHAFLRVRQVQKIGRRELGYMPRQWYLQKHTQVLLDRQGRLDLRIPCTNKLQKISVILVQKFQIPKKWNYTTSDICFRILGIA